MLASRKSPVFHHFHDSPPKKSRVVQRILNGWYFGNIIFGGIVLGMLIVDPLSGAMFTLDSDKVDMVLESLGSKTTKADGSLTIVNVADVPAAAMQFARRVN